MLDEEQKQTCHDNSENLPWELKMTTGTDRHARARTTQHRVHTTWHTIACAHPQLRKELPLSAFHIIYSYTCSVYIGLEDMYIKSLKPVTRVK